LFKIISENQIYEANQMKIIAIGGGGFTHDTEPDLDDLCLSETGCNHPRVAFIGTASGDDPVKIERFRARFADVAASLEHFQMTLSAAQLTQKLGQVDLVYVGGGDTEKMVSAWRQSGWDDVLRKAYQSGVILAGVSAGAVCWFDTFLFSSGKGVMRPLPDRREALHAAVTAKTMPASVAIDDGVAIVFENGSPTRVFTAQKGSGAYMVYWSPQGATEQTLSID
jgi:peptidase E